VINIFPGSELERRNLRAIRRVPFFSMLSFLFFVTENQVIGYKGAAAQRTEEK